MSVTANRGYFLKKINGFPVFSWLAECSVCVPFWKEKRKVKKKTAAKVTIMEMGIAPAPDFATINPRK